MSPPDHRVPPDKLTTTALDAAFAEVERVAAERGIGAEAFTDMLLSRAVARLRDGDDRERLHAKAAAAVAQRVDALLGAGPDRGYRASRLDRASAHFVDAVWRALRDGAGPQTANATARFVARFGAAAHAPTHAVADLLYELGLGAVAAADPLKTLRAETETLFDRPAARGTGVIGTDFLRVADVAALLIRLERLGLDVDPAPLAAALRPVLARKDKLTRAEIDVWWFERERHRSQPVILAVDGERDFARSEELTTEGGYKIEAWMTADDRVVHLWITPPKYRRESSR